MKVLSIFGGPRKKGNTARILGWVEEELSDRGHAVERINMIDKNVAGCLGCSKCQEIPDQTGCVQNDDAPAIFEKMIASDAVIFACPLYCWGFPAQIKTIIDRGYCLVTGYDTGKPHSLVRDRASALVVSCAGPIENNADLIVETYRRFSDYVMIRPTTELVVPLCTTPDALGENVQQQAVEAAAKLTG